MSGVQSSASDIDVDLGRLFGSLARRWKRILSIALAVTALALVFAWFATPHYKGETRILIETRESVFTRPQTSSGDDRPLLDEEGVTSQVEVITSTDYKLGAGVHIEQMTTNSSSATTGINLTGNEVAQKIFGNAGTVLIDGKGGSDTLQGGSGTWIEG